MKRQAGRQSRRQPSGRWEDPAREGFGVRSPATRAGNTRNAPWLIALLSFCFSARSVVEWEPGRSGEAVALPAVALVALAGAAIPLRVTSSAVATILRPSALGVAADAAALACSAYDWLAGKYPHVDDFCGFGAKFPSPFGSAALISMNMAWRSCNRNHYPDSVAAHEPKPLRPREDERARRAREAGFRGGRAGTADGAPRSGRGSKARGRAPFCETRPNVAWRVLEQITQWFFFSRGVGDLRALGLR